MLYYIFCEGLQTEPLYFQGFKRLIEENPIYREMVLIEIEPCGAETLRVIHQAEISTVCRVLYFTPDGDLSDLLLPEK